jgi:hypothetical protein
MDGMVRDPRSKRTKAFVVTLGGKDYAMARLTDAKMAIQAGRFSFVRCGEWVASVQCSLQAVIVLVAAAVCFWGPTGCLFMSKRRRALAGAQLIFSQGQGP